MKGIPRMPACIPGKKSHHFFSTVLGSTDGDSKYEGPPNSTGSLTSAFKSRKPKGTEFTASAPPATLESPASQAPSAALKAPEQEQAASKKGSGRRFVKAGQSKGLESKPLEGGQDLRATIYLICR
jgi:hypothetical protein